MDVTDECSLSGLISEVGSQHISLLVIAAGSQETDKLETVTKDNIRRQMESNAIGPLFSVKALQHLLQKGSKVINFSYSVASRPCSYLKLPLDT